jgi:hypothetical protein
MRGMGECWNDGIVEGWNGEKNSETGDWKLDGEWIAARNT